MKRWIWTLLIIFTLGMTVACGSKKGGSGATPAPTDPSTPTDPGVIPPGCTTPDNCVIPQPTFNKVFAGQFTPTSNSTSSPWRKLLRDLKICDLYQADPIFGIGGNVGTADCGNYNEGYLFFHVIGTTVDAYLAAHCSAGGWAPCWGWTPSYQVMNYTPLYAIDNNTGLAAYRTTPLAYGHYPPPNPNQMLQFRIENQNLNGNSVQIKIRYNNADIGTITAYAQ
jgi:hypothetical protein